LGRSVLQNLKQWDFCKKVHGDYGKFFGDFSGGNFEKFFLEKRVDVPPFPLEKSGGISTGKRFIFLNG